MKNYEKPVVLANSELSEGIFAASGMQAGGNPGGSTGGGTGSLSVTASIIGSDAGSNSSSFAGTAINNTGADISDWSISLSFSGQVKSASVSNCNVSISGSSITITPARDYNQTLKPGEFQTLSGTVTGDTVLSLA